jgi:rare lipoprotein A (peptidoglycan hydrolase)
LATGSVAGTASPSDGAAAAALSASVAPAHPIPASFRSSGISPGAPSDAEVRAELKQMYAAQRQARSAAAANLAGLLPWVDEPKTGEHVSVASVFVDYGLGLACGGLLGVNQIGVAHKTAPCGTLIDFTYNGRTLQVPVIDRGPYVAGREWDLTGATARALGFPGLGPIEWSCASC